MHNLAETTDALIKWCQKRGETSGVDEFITYLSDTNGLYLLPQIMDELETRSRNMAFANKLHIITAQRTEENDIPSLATAFGLEDADDAAHSSNPALIAGVSCEYKGVQIKDNLHGRLQALQNRLHI